MGILFLVIGGLNINKPKDCRSATILNDLILITVFLISILNVMISGFGFDNSTYTLQLMSESASASMTPVESVPPFRPSWSPFSILFTKCMETLITKHGDSAYVQIAFVYQA